MSERKFPVDDAAKSGKRKYGSWGTGSVRLLTSVVILVGEVVRVWGAF